ncbi:MAG: phosphoglucosamine mutase, partial [Bdellovibrionota bacterium]
MERTLFGTDGIRGEAGTEPMTPEMAVRLGRAIAYWFGAGQGRRPRILIGKDTRLSGYIFETALTGGICAAGGDVLLVGPMPTPGIAFLTQDMRADAGVVISASHNPFQDNGIKLFGPAGFKLPDETEAKIEALVREPGELDRWRPAPEALGKAFRIDDAAGRYVLACKRTFPRELRLDGLKIALDCANGAAYGVSPLVFRELGAEVFDYGVEPNGKNINEKCGSLHPEFIAKKVREHGADVGVALDGDGDRAIFVDEKGAVVDGDQVMAVCARQMLAEGRLAKKTLVATVMSNLALDKWMEKLGGKLERTPVGDRYVLEAMQKGGYSLGGEQSGHVIFLDHSTTGDGTVCALQVLAVMKRTGKPLSAL